MQFQNTKVFNLVGAIYSARNALSSWNKSDSDLKNEVLGKNDLQLAQRLILAGSEHRKFMRQILVTVDIIAPIYFWSEFDAYKVGVTRSSTSFQHTGMSRDLGIDDFELDEKFFVDRNNFDIEMKRLKENDEVKTDEEKLKLISCRCLITLISVLNALREQYVITKDYEYFRIIRQLLPSSFCYRSTVIMNYEVILNMIKQRKNHALKEWRVDFINWTKFLPYADDLLFL